MMRSLALALALAACGGGGDDPPAGVDAPSDDAQSATVVEVTCDGSEVATVVTQAASKFDPMSTSIAVNDVVKFEMDPSHDVAPHLSLPSDPGIRVDFGETKCLRFTQAGTFNFFCTSHGFAGSVTVN